MMSKVSYIFIICISTVVMTVVWRLSLYSDYAMRANQQKYVPPSIKGYAYNDIDLEPLSMTSAHTAKLNSSSSSTQISAKAVYSTSTNPVGSSSTQRPTVKSILSSSQSSSTKSATSSASSSTARTNLDILKLNGKEVLTAETLAQIVHSMTTKVSNMTFISDKTFPQNFSLQFLPEYKNPCWKEKRKLWCLPYFFVGGFPKCGTTDLFSKLIKHPEIVQGYRKEPHWWTRKRFTSETFSSYKRFFEKGIRKINKSVDETGFHPLVATEGSACTVWDNKNLFSKNSYDDPPYLNIHVIQSILPNAKFVVIIRNPVNRLYSDYLFFQKTYTPEEFHSQVEHSITVFNECFENPKTSFLYCVYGHPTSHSKPKLYNHLRIAFYYVHLSVVLSVYPRSNVFLLRLEDYMQDQPLWLRKIMNFLDISPISAEDLIVTQTEKPRNANKNGYVKAGPMLNQTMSLLTEFFKPFNTGLLSLFNDIEPY